MLRLLLLLFCISNFVISQPFDPVYISTARSADVSSQNPPKSDPNEIQIGNSEKMFNETMTALNLTDASTAPKNITINLNIVQFIFNLPPNSTISGFQSSNGTSEMRNLFPQGGMILPNYTYQKTFESSKAAAIAAEAEQKRELEILKDLDVGHLQVPKSDAKQERQTPNYIPEFFSNGFPVYPEHNGSRKADAIAAEASEKREDLDYSPLPINDAKVETQNLPKILNPVPLNVNPIELTPEFYKKRNKFESASDATPVLEVRVSHDPEVAKNEKIMIQNIDSEMPKVNDKASKMSAVLQNDENNSDTIFRSLPPSPVSLQDFLQLRSEKKLWV